MSLRGRAGKGQPQNGARVRCRNDTVSSPRYGTEEPFQGYHSSTDGACGQRRAIPRRAYAERNDPAESPNHKEQDHRSDN